jgi:hypothetical protein
MPKVLRTGRPSRGTYPMLGRLTWIVLHTVGMTDRIAARYPAARAQRPPNSVRRSRRKGANSETRRTRAPLSLRSCLVVSRAVSSRISDVASAASRCGTAGPDSTERWRSRRELVALLPQVIAGTLALRTVICSMSLPTRTSPPGPGRVTLSPRRGTRVSASQDSPSPQGC